MTSLSRPPGAASLAGRRPASADIPPGASSPRRLRLLPSTDQRGDIKSQQSASAQTMALLGGRGKRMAMHLLERDHELATLEALLGETTTGQGRITLISGEAGIGKTALVEHFVAQARSKARLPYGRCGQRARRSSRRAPSALSMTSPGRPHRRCARSWIAMRIARRSSPLSSTTSHRRLPYSSSRTSTGPTRRRWISSSTSLAASPVPQPCSSLPIATRN